MLYIILYTLRKKKILEIVSSILQENTILVFLLQNFMFNSLCYLQFFAIVCERVSN